MNRSDNLSLSLKGQLLLAMPRIGDPRFHHAVILMCVHDEKGAMGLTINQPLETPDFPELLRQLNIEAGEDLPRALRTLPVLEGGPVEDTRGFLLHSSDFHQKDTIVIDDQFHVSGTIDSLRTLMVQMPEKMLFTLGYAGWGAGQLEAELADNAWITIPATHEIVFNTHPDDMWDKAFSALGINPSMISGLSGHA